MLRAQQAYERGRQLAARLVPQLEEGQLRLSYPNQQSLLYLLALCQLLSNAAAEAQSTINLFLGRHRKKTLEEVYHFARLLQLLIHFDLQHTELLPYQIQAFRSSQPQLYPQSTALLLQYLQQLLDAPGLRQRRALLKAWRHQIETAQLTIREGRFYEYLDLVYWMATKQKGKH